MAVLVVANTGAAIDPEDLARVFQRFYRTDHSRASRTGGTGLGLAIVREIVFAHGGTVEARSEGDGWVRFEGALPLAVTGEGSQKSGRPAIGGAAVCGPARPRGPRGAFDPPSRQGDTETACGKRCLIRACMGY